jgi:hypothetical protein
MTDEGKVEGAQVVHRRDGTEFLRTNPDGDTALCLTIRYNSRGDKKEKK